MDGKYGYIDKTGKYIINPQFDSAGFFFDGLAVVRIKGMYGYIDKKGNFIINPQFYYAPHSFSCGRALVQFGEKKFGFIDRTGKIINKEPFNNALDFSEEHAAVMTKETEDGMAKWGYIDTNGNYVINPQFDDAWYFSEGLAAVKIGSKKMNMGIS